MIKRKSKLKLISGLITAIMIFNSLSVFASYNGGSSGKSYNSNGGDIPSSATTSKKNQMIKCSLYFCPMDGVTMDGTEASRDEMDARWAKGKHIQQVGKSIYIGRDGASKGSGGYYYSGNIAGSDLFDSSFEQYRKRYKTNTDSIFYYVSDLGLEADLPIAITDAENVRGTKEYFMIKRSDYVEGQTSEYDTKENMRKLIHAISGTVNANGKTLDKVSFSRSESGLETFNDSSDFDSGLYGGQLGEYKLYLENCITVGASSNSSTVVTVRDAIKVDFANDTDRRTWQSGVIAHLGSNFYLDKKDTFRLLPKGTEITSKGSEAFNALKNALNSNQGYGVNILSSELFRDPKTRSIGSHVNVFLPLDAGFTAIDDSYAAKWSREGTQNTGVAAIGMEYIGNKVSEETLYKEALKFFNNMSSAQKLKETISNQIESGVATNDPTLYELNNRRNHFLDEATNYMEEIDDASKIAKLYRSFDERAFADAYSQTIELISYGEVKRGYSTKSLELFNYVNGLQKSGTIASFDGTINDRKWLNGSIILDSNAKDETVLEQAANQDSFVYSSNVLNALDNSTQLVVNTEWENTINKINYEYATEMSPIVSGETMLTVFNNSMQSAQLPKGLVKDMSTMLLSDLGELVNNKVENARRAIYGGEYFNTYKDNSSDIDDMILNYLGGGIDDSFSQSNDHGDVSGVGLYVEYPGEWVKEALPSATNNTLLSSYLPSIYNGQGLYDYPIVNVNKVEDASYGSVQNGDIHAVNVDVLGVNHALEAAISLAPYGGYRIMKPTSWIEQGYATGLRGFRNHLTGTVIIPSRWLSSIDNKTETEVIAEASENAVIESKNYYDATNSGRMTHVVSEAITAIDDLQAVQDIAGGVPNTPSTDGNFIQSTSNSKLNTILPEENSEIGDRGWGRIGLKGNYAISYDIYDRSIPVDVVMVFRDSEGNIIPSTPVNGTEKTLAYWFNVYNVNPGIEKVLDIQEEFLMPGKNNEEFRVIPKEAIIKPAYISLYDFLSQMNSMEGDKLEFKHDNLDVVTKLEKAPFEVNLGSGARKYFPYVEMVYDYVKDNNIKENIGVYTLAGHESQLYPRDYIEVGYKTYSDLAGRDTMTGLVVEAQQWSTHKGAIRLSESMKTSFDSKVDHTARVLPGGAIYRLRTPNEGTGKVNRTKVIVKNYLTYIPDDVVKTGAIKEGGDAFSLDSQLARKDGLLHQIKRSLNSLDVVQVTQNKNGNSIKIDSKDVVGASGQKVSKDSKYWLTQGLIDGATDGATKVNSAKPNEADLDIVNPNTKVVYYRIQSDVYGNVILTKTGDSGNAEWKIDKTQGADKLISQAEELKDLDNKTKLITNYLNSIDRNQGSDVNGNTWYNEAFDGLCVALVEDTFEVGFADGQSDINSVARTAVIDVKLQPVRNGQAELFNRGVYSHFETKTKTNMGGTTGYTIQSHGKTVEIPKYKDADGYVGTYVTQGSTGNIEIYIPSMNGMYRSKDFIIPNVSVMDLY